jgi:hypothetical protein
MGAVAFSLLEGTELGVSVFTFDQTIADYLAGYWSTPGVIGLVAQVAFAFIPLLQDTH